MSLAKLDRLPPEFETALAAAVDKVFADKGLTFGAEPAYASPVPAGTDIDALHAGAQLLGLPVTPQGVRVAGVMEARDALGNPLYEECAIELPRRGTKTTTVQMVLLGRCANIPGYRVVSTAQDGTRASQFFANMMRSIEAKLAREGLQPADVGIRMFYHSQGREYIEWLNGSKWWVVKPDPQAFRGEAADCMWFDEAGELDPNTSADLQAGALPLMDTRDGGQIIVSGTPGLVRAGLFWDYLEQGRTDPAKFGIIEYAATDYEDPTDERVWMRVHPGLAAGLTTIEKMRKRFATMPLPQFMREYLCIWPPDSTVTALDLVNWENTAGDHLAEPPEGVPFGIGYDVAIGGSAAAVAVAWFDAQDEPHVQVMQHRAGSGWVGKTLAQALLTHPRVLVGYDNIGDNITVAQALGRMERLRAPHHARIKPLPLKEVAAATAVVSQANDLLTLHHAAHPGLDTAVKHAAWRDSGGSRLFMRLKGQEITCLMACVHALAVAGTAKRTRDLVMPAAQLG